MAAELRTVTSERLGIRRLVVTVTGLCAAVLLWLGARALDAAGVDAANGSARWLLVGWLAGLAALVGAATFAASRVERLVLADLEYLLAAMTRVTNGHLGERLDTDRGGVVGTVSRRFNNMVRAVEDSRREIGDQARALERRLADRTAELHRANHTLRTFDQAKDAFLANVSHELRTPLTAILASSAVLRDLEQADARTLAEFVAIIEHEAGRLLELVNKALSVAETESTLPVLRRLPTDVLRLAEATVERCRSRCAERGIAVVRHFAVGDAVVRCDGEQLAAALECLLDNAAKFSPRGGTVELIVRDDEDDVVAFEVRDEGTGVPADERARIFERFTQAGEALTDKPQGFGLGLPLSRRILQAHGGTVDYVARQGWGACFVMRLPRQERAVAHPMPVAARLATPLRSPSAVASARA